MCVRVQSNESCVRFYMMMEAGGVSADYHAARLPVVEFVHPVDGEVSFVYVHLLSMKC